MAPMGTNYGTTDGFATDRDKRLLRRARQGRRRLDRDRGDEHLGRRPQPQQLAVRVSRRVHSRAERRWSARFTTTARSRSRSSIIAASCCAARCSGWSRSAPRRARHPATGEPVRALRLDEIHQIQRDFLDASRRLWRAGYDAVEIHAANGYLFQQFFSPRFNRRDDDYGGALANRMRLLLETVGLIRAELPGFPGAGSIERDRIRRRRLFRRRADRAGAGARAGGRRRDRPVGRIQRKPGAVALLHPAAVVSAPLPGALRAAAEARARHPGDHRRPHHHAGGCRGGAAGRTAPTSFRSAAR